MSGVAPDPAALTDLIARLRHDGALEPEVALMGLEFRYLNDVADALEVLVARTTELEHAIAQTAAKETAWLERLGPVQERLAELEARTTPPEDAAEVMALFGYTLPEFVYLLRRHARGAGLLAADLIENAYLGVTTEGEPG